MAQKPLNGKGIRAPKLKDEHRAFIVERVACYDGPDSIAEAVKERYGIAITAQTVQHYDPTKKGSKGLAKQWRELFATIRKAFLEHVEDHIPAANKAVRLKKLANAADVLERKGNYLGMADLLERIAKEVGNVHTNRRELTGADGKPMQFQEIGDMTEQQLKDELRTLLAPAIAAADPSTTKH